MTTYRYELVVVAPDVVDGDTAEEIGEQSDGTPDDAVRRWLGFFIDKAEDDLKDAMPEGWGAYIAEAS